MGAAKKNYYATFHWTLDSNKAREPQEITFRVHQANLSLDVTLPACTAAQAVDLINDAGDAQAFSATAQVIWGSLWTGLGAADQEALRLWTLTLA